MFLFSGIFGKPVSGSGIAKLVSGSGIAMRQQLVDRNTANQAWCCLQIQFVSLIVLTTAAIAASLATLSRGAYWLVHSTGESDGGLTR